MYYRVSVSCLNSMCVYVRVCHCVLSASKSVLRSAVVLLLFSCCRRNTVVAKLRLLPCCHISCSRFPPWLRTWPPFILKHHLLPLQAAGSPAAVGLNSRLIPIHAHINRNVMESIFIAFDKQNVFKLVVWEGLRWTTSATGTFQPPAGNPVDHDKVSGSRCTIKKKTICVGM